MLFQTNEFLLSSGPNPKRRLPLSFSLAAPQVFEAGQLTHSEVHVLNLRGKIPARDRSTSFRVILSLWSDRKRRAQRRIKCSGRRSKDAGTFMIDVSEALRQFLASVTLTDSDRIGVKVSEPRRWFRHRQRRRLTTPNREGVLMLFSRGAKAFSLEQEVRMGGRERPRRSFLQQVYGKYTDRLDKPQDGPPFCRLYRFNLDFDRLGWYPQIIAPRQIGFSFCHGGCEGIPHTLERPNNHASVLGSLNLMMNERNSPHGPKCAPTAYEPLDVLEVKGPSVVLRRVSDVFVSQCGCR